MQRHLDTRPTTHPTTGPASTTPSKKLPIDYYRVPLDSAQIHFIDSSAGYERLLARLFNEEQLLIGFDCTSCDKRLLRLTRSFRRMETHLQ